MLCGWEVNAGVVHSMCGSDVWVAGKTVITCHTRVRIMCKVVHK